MTVQKPSLLPPSFFARDAVVVAQDLLGCVVSLDGVALRICETEAYRGDETACHAHRGQTRRNAPLFGPPGHAYIYLCYGIHQMLNFVTGPEGEAQGVLLRGATIEAGVEVVQARRGGRLDLIGPGKLGQALGIDTSKSGAALNAGWLEARSGTRRAAEVVEAGPRVGIGYARPEHQALPWRFRLRTPRSGRPR